MLDRPADSTSPVASAHHEGLSGSTGDLLILIGRILVGQLYVVSGWGKLMGLTGFAAYLVKNGVPEGMTGVLSVVAACIEFFGGLAIVLGLAIRWTAPLMLIFTIVAAFVGHRYWDVVDPVMRAGQKNNFYKNAAICGGFLFLMVSGAGRFSIDGMFRRRAA
jgi:putative oxidoreductase